MSKEAVFSMKLETELRDAFMAEAAAAERPASQIVSELMRDFVKAQTEQRRYDDFVRRKVGSPVRKSRREELFRKKK